jgi:putative hydrolase of the HAD superfamily
VVFDLDRTLLDHDRAAESAVGDWLTDFGIAAAALPGLLMRWQEAEARQFARYVSGELTFHQQRRERIREMLPFLGIAQYTNAVADRMFMAYLTHHERGWVAFEDADPVLRRVRESGRVVAVLTNGDEVQQRRKLRRIGLLDVCGQVFASSALPAGKPDRRAFRTVSKMLRLKPDECLMVGDDLEADVRGALNAGWHAVHLDRKGRSRAEVSRIASLTELSTD